MPNPELDITSTAKASIKEAFRTVDWWALVQKDAQRSILYLIEHLEVLGRPFRDSFRAGCRYQHQVRKLQRLTTESPGVLFGSRLSEENYQSGIAPARLLLGLDDWLLPNEADVQACRQLCDHVDILETFGVLQTEEEDVSVKKLLTEALFTPKEKKNEPK